jgi:hypothetical protein
MGRISVMIARKLFDAPGLYCGLQETLYLAPQRIAGLFFKMNA